MNKPNVIGKLIAHRHAFGLAVVLVGAVFYATTFWLNQWLFVTIEFNHRVNWLFIPSGVRLLMVMLSDHLGALGIVLGSYLIEWLYFDNEADWLNLVSPLISGGAPLLAKWTLAHWFKVGANLERLTPKILAQYALWFAGFSSTLHQIWFAIHTTAAYRIEGWIPMFIGDVMGNLFVLGLLYVVVKVARRWRGRAGAL